MNLQQDRIKEIVHNGYALDFADVFKKHLKTIKKALYAGLMIFVFMVILILIIVSVGISFLGLGHYLESMKELSLNMENLSESISLTIRGINFILRSN
jgi:hypothetical protein